MQEAAFSFTTKINTDLLTVRGATPEEFKTNLQALTQSADIGKEILKLQAIGGKR